LLLFSRRLFHPEFVANAEAKEEEENGAEDGLNGGKHYQTMLNHCYALA